MLRLHRSIDINRNRLNRKKIEYFLSVYSFIVSVFKNS
jgi:hypothetical protein